MISLCAVATGKKGKTNSRGKNASSEQGGVSDSSRAAREINDVALSLFRQKPFISKLKQEMSSKKVRPVLDGAASFLFVEDAFRFEAHAMIEKKQGLSVFNAVALLFLEQKRFDIRLKQGIGNQMICALSNLLLIRSFR